MPRPKSVERFVDRHGRERWYFRQGKGARIALPHPGNIDAPSNEFWNAYGAAEKAEPPIGRRPIVPRLHPTTKCGLVYVIGYDRYVKIGFTTDLSNRMGGLATGSPKPVTVYFAMRGSIQIERYLHKRFAEYRVKNEWFHLEGKLKEWFDRKLEWQEVSP